MKNAYEVLYQKEADLTRVRREVASLIIAASLLDDDDLSFFAPHMGGDVQNKKRAEKELSRDSDAEATGTDDLSAIPRQPGFWESMKRKRG
jgi:hypothetical protein